jgi:protein-disulfide isomerase
MKESSESKPFNVAPVLVTLLILASFFLGSLWTKVQYLEKNGVQAVALPTNQANSDQPAVNEPVAAAQPPAQKATKTPVITNADYVRGNTNAKVTLVEYSDLECPFCKRFHPTMLQIMKEYGDKVKWVFRHYPLSFHANAQKEAEATECAGKLGGNETFWKYIDAILERTTSNGTGFALDQLAPLAKELGLNEGKFKTCLDSGEFTQKVKDQTQSGTVEGVSGTPGTIIIDAKGDTQLIPGALPFEQIKPMIDTALQTL